MSPAPHPEWLRRISERYYSTLLRISSGPRPYFAAAATVLIIAVVVTTFFTVRLLPSIHDGHLVVEYEAPMSTSLSVMQDYGARITRALMRDPNVAHVYQRSGRPDFGSRAPGTHHAQLDIALRDGLSMRGQNIAQSRVRVILESFDGISAVVRTRLVSQVFGPQTGATSSVRVIGPDLDSIDQIAQQVAGVVRSLPHAGPVTVQNGGLGPVVRVDLNFERLALYGLSSADILSAVQTAFEGTRAAQIFDHGKEIDIAVTAEANVRRDPEAVGDLLIRSSQGISAPLKYVANVYLTAGRNTIEHDNGVRRQIVTFEPGGDVGTFLNTARAEIERRIRLPIGTYLEYDNAGEEHRPAVLVNSGCHCLDVRRASVAFLFCTVTRGLRFSYCVQQPSRSSEGSSP